MSPCVTFTSFQRRVGVKRKNVFLTNIGTCVLKNGKKTCLSSDDLCEKTWHIEPLVKCKEMESEKVQTHDHDISESVNPVQVRQQKLLRRCL